MRFTFAVFGVLLAACVAVEVRAGDPERGYRLLVEKSYLPPDFHQDAFDQIWRQWPEPLRTQAEQATLAERRRLAYARYGLTSRPPRFDATAPGDPGPPLQYVVTEDGQWVMNCFACHGGKVAGRVIPGLPNSHYLLHTLSDEMRSTKLSLEQPLTRMEIGAMFIPLGTTRGTTNAVMFGVGLMANRDAELNVRTRPTLPPMTHHDMDAPPWWHFRKKSHVYIDGFAERGHRGLMQFMLVTRNGPEKFREWEEDYRAVYAYLESLEAPRYPFAVDQPLAAQGKLAFVKHCAECHGTYGQEETYPNRVVAIEEVGTDPVRLNALSAEARKRYGASWFGHHGEQDTRLEPGGYVAPPLDGVWASAPYLHNGAVPTLWHVLHPAERPTVWRRASEDGYDQTKVGLEIEALEQVPPDVKDARERREYFDTGRFGKSAAGHDFPDVLTETEKRAVLEYLKTL